MGKNGACGGVEQAPRRGAAGITNLSCY
jgi:hypothetical protein